MTGKRKPHLEPSASDQRPLFHELITKSSLIAVAFEIDEGVGKLTARIFRAQMAKLAQNSPRLPENELQGSLMVNPTSIILVGSVCIALMQQMTSRATAEDTPSIAQIANRGIEPNTESIAAYLLTLAAQTDDRDQFADWVRQLGDRNFDQREAATHNLLNCNSVHFDLLEEAITSDDAEVSNRASLIHAELLARPPRQRQQKMLDTVLRVIVEREIKNLAASILEVVSNGRMPVSSRRLVKAISATAVDSDQELLLRSLKSESQLVRLAALSGLEQISGSGIVPVAATLLDDPDESVRLAVARTLARNGDRRSLVVLTALLESDTTMIRSIAVRTLRQLTGEVFQFDAFDADVKQRRIAATKWISWVEENGDSAKLASSIQDIAVDNRGLVLHLSFDNPKAVAEDKSGKENSGKAHHAAYTGHGYSAGACEFDGSGDYITIANNETLELTDALTISMWVKLDSFGPGGYGNEEGHFLKKGDPLWWNPTFGMGYRKGSRRAKFVVGHPNSPVTGGGADLYSETLLDVGRWHHLLGTYDGKTAKFFIDGQLDVEQAYEGKLRADKAPVMLGGGKLFSTSQFSNHFAIDGTVDEVRIYNRALQPDEIEMLFDE